MANKKIDGFLDTVYGAAEAKSAKMMREIDRAGESALREYRASLRRDAEAKRRSETLRAAKKGAESAAQDESAIRRELLLKRAAISDEVFSAVRARLAQYRTTPAYRDALVSDAVKASQALSGTTAPAILIGSADEAFADEISAAAGIPVRVDATITLGGVKGSSDEMECDLTLDARLTVAMKDFERESGLSVI